MALGLMGVRCLKEQLSDYILYNRYTTTFVNHKEMVLTIVMSHLTVDN